MKLPLSCLLLAMAPACFARMSMPAPQPASAPPAAPIRATISLRDPATLEVSYQLPPSCPALDFRNEGIRPGVAAGLRSDWQAADACTEFDGRQIRRKHPSCSTVRLRVPATTRRVDRVYPWAFPVERGLYVHTVAYAPAPACGPVDWHFVVPGGTVVIDGAMMAERGARSAAEGGGDEMPTVLIQDRFGPGTKPRVHVSSAFTPSTRALLERTVASIEGELKKMLPGLALPMPFIVASASEPGTYWGDVARRTVMRLSFPPTPGPEQEQLLHSFVTHEMAHLAQPSPSNWNDSWKEDGATIGEGGAEFLRVLTATRLGWLDRAAMQGELEKAVNGCLLAAEGKSWKAMRDRNWGTNPYNCGLAFYMMGLASASASASAPAPAPPLLRLRDYYARAKQGERTDFARAVECGAVPGCTPRWLPRLAGDEALETVLLDYARQPGSLLRASSGWAPAMIKPMAFRYLGLLMRADCKGSISMYQEAAAARIAEGPACGALRPGMVVVTAEGLPLFDDSAALKALVQACHGRANTVLGLRDGGSVTVACDASIRLPAQLYSVDIDKALALMK